MQSDLKQRLLFTIFKSHGETIMSTQKNVLVIGATGQQGGATVQALLPKGHRIKALTRKGDSPAAKKLASQGVELIQGDLTDTEALVNAMKAVDSVFAVTTPYGAGPDAETRQGIILADAAKAANVGHLVFSSVGSADQGTGIPHFESKYRIEQHIAAIKIP